MCNIHTTLHTQHASADRLSSLVQHTTGHASLSGEIYCHNEEQMHTKKNRKPKTVILVQKKTLQLFLQIMECITMFLH